MTKKLDPEIKTLRAVARAKVGQPARERIAAWLWRRVEADGKAWRERGGDPR